MRGRAGVFDVSHMGQLEVLGPEAFPYLQHRLSNDLDKIAPGGAQYTLLTNERGGVIDDLIAYRREDGYLLVVNAANVERDAAALAEARDVSADWAMLAVQGPAALELLGHGCRAVRVPRGRGARHPLRRLRDRVHGRARVRAALRPRRRRGAVGSRARARRRSVRARRPRHAPARGVLPAARAGSHRGANADRGGPRLGLRAREGVPRRRRCCAASATRARPSVWWRSPWRRRRSRARAWPCTKAAR